MLLPETNLEAATLIAERLRQAVEKLTFRILHDKIIALSISIGVACSTEVEQDLEKLWHESDVRLYQAKSAGRNQVVTAKSLSYPLFNP